MSLLETYSTAKLVDAVVAGIQEKKGTNIVILNLSEVDAAICHYFVICEGNSSTHADAVADSVEEVVRTRMGEKALHVEGHATAQWILIDYSDVIVHVFQRSVRHFYGLEELWNDAVRTDLENIF